MVLTVLRHMHWFCVGRHLGGALVLLICAAPVCFFWWDGQYPLYLTGGSLPVWLTTLNTVPVIAGMLAVALAAPNAAHAERLSVRRVRTSSAAGVAVVGTFAAVLGPFPYLLFTVIPKPWIPRVEWYSPGDGPYFDESFDRMWFWMKAAFVLVFVGWAIIGVACLGRLGGVCLALVVYAIYVVVASLDPDTPLSPFVLTDPVTMHWSWVIGSMLWFLLALGVWWRTAASAPLMR